MEFLRSLTQNSRIRMMAAGAVSVAFAYCTFLFCLYIGIHYLIASIANFFTYIFINFVLNRKWAFHSNGEIKKQALAHISLHFGNQVLILVGLYVMVESMGILPAWAQVIMQVIVALTSFIITPIIFSKK